jgi:hypothetical protein
VSTALAIDAPDAVVPGDLLEGTVRWQLAAAPRDAELRLVWSTVGAGLADEHVVETLDVAGLPAAAPAITVPEGPYRGAQVVDALAPGALKASDARRFQLRAPLAPPSFRGALVRLSWRLELWVESASTSRPLVIAPARLPLELP